MTSHMKPPTSVLFVCLGNICRSPLAEGALRKMCRDAGFDCVIDSAGTAAYHTGDAPDARAIKVAAQNGADITGLAARQIEPEDFYKFTHIFALDRANLEGIKAAAPRDGTAKIAMVLDCLEGCQGQSVDDPYYGDEVGFQVVWEEVSLAASALVKQFAKHGAEAQF